MENDRIAALATPYGSGALAVIRASGPGSIESIAAISDRAKRILATPGGRLRRALLVDPESGEVLDEVVLAIYRAPASYTGEDAVEISCHGSASGIRRILSALMRGGFRPADPGEFTMRAFLAGKLDLTRAEAVNEVVGAETAAAHEMALRRLGGSIETTIDTLKRELIPIMAAVTVQIDYPEEETGEIPIPREAVASVHRALRELAESYRTGRLYQEGIRVALVGRTNAGKSSLFNAILKEERAIVSEVHGTTRDYIESRVDLSGIPASIFDTAGLRRSKEEIEGEGMRRTRAVIESADVVLYVVDGVCGWEKEDERLLAEIDASTEGEILTVWNKIDSERCLPYPAESVAVSATTLEGISALAERVRSVVQREERTRPGTVVIDSLRQRNLLERAAAALDYVLEGLDAGTPVDAIGLDLQEALDALGEITGEVTSADILDAVFGEFCVGK